MELTQGKGQLAVPKPRHSQRTTAWGVKLPQKLPPAACLALALECSGKRTVEATRLCCDPSDHYGGIKKALGS